MDYDSLAQAKPGLGIASIIVMYKQTDLNRAKKQIPTRAKRIGQTRLSVDTSTIQQTEDSHPWLIKREQA